MYKFKQALISAALLTFIAASSAQAQTTNVLTTGAASNSNIGGYLVDSNDSVDGLITLSGPQAITSITTYLTDGSVGDKFDISLYSNTSKNMIGSLLDTTVATYSGNTGWNGSSGLNWAVSGGNYWVEITSSEGAILTATSGAKTLLAKTASSGDGLSSYSYYNINGTGNAKDLSFGLTVASVSAVPEASTWLMLLLGLGVVGFVASRVRSGTSGSTLA